MADTAERAMDLLLRAQQASPHPILLKPLADEWEMSWRTVRRSANDAVAIAASYDDLGTLDKEGQGEQARLRWRWTRTPRERARRSEVTGLLAALGPWKAIGVDDITMVLQRHLEAAIAQAPASMAPRIEQIAERGFYYQPYMPRAWRDETVVNDVLSALFFGRGLAVGHYASPRGEYDDLVLEPRTLVHAMDGLYVVAARAGAPDEPRMWALHRMQHTRCLRDHPVEVPDDYDPRDLLGHGYGPFVDKGDQVVVIRVPADQAGYVLESPLPSQVGEPEALEDGSYRVTLDVGPHWGVKLWARGMRVEIERVETP